MKGKISTGLFIELKQIVKYRNKLTHGKRFNEDVVLDNIEDTYKIMTQILEEK